MIKQEKQSNQKFINLEDLCNLCAINYFEASFYQDAIQFFSESINHGMKAKSEKIGITYYNRGLCNYLLNDIDNSIKDFTSALDLGFKSDQVFRMRSLMYRRKEKNDLAEEDEKEALKLNPNCKFITLFSHRLLDKDTTLLMFSYLDAKSLLKISETCRYWYNNIRFNFI